MKPTAAVTGGRTRAGRGRVFNGRQVAAEGPRDGTQEVKRAEVEGAEGVQGSRVYSPASATLQAPGLPYTSGPYLEHASAT
jgi:hypothetical protein